MIKAFNYGTGWASRLWLELEEPAFYSFYLRNLNLPKLESYKSIFRDLPVQQIKQAIRTEFKPPYRFKLEVGDWNMNEPQTHVHILANIDAGLLGKPRDGKMIQPLTTLKDFENVVTYLSKPKLTYSPELEKVLEEERKRLGLRQMPRAIGNVWT